jgi:predicted MFS family arabinose efflux permease
MAQNLVTHHTQADTARERLRLWRVQLLFAAAVAAASVGGIWLSAMGAGAAGAAAAIVAGLAPTAVATPLAAWAAGRVSRRAVLRGAPMVLAAAVLAGEVASPEIGVGAVVACVAVIGAARAAFDGATADLLHQLTAPGRRLDACGDLTARFGGGSAAGLAGALLVGLVAGPHGAIALGGVLAAVASLVATRHHPDIDLRPEGQPLWRALGAAVRLVADDRPLRRILVTGAWSTAVGAAQAAVLIVWLRDDVGLRGALVPALLGGFVAMRIGRPLVLRLAGSARPGSVLTMALAVQASASLAAYSAHGSLGAASAYALSLAAGAFLGILVNRALRASSPPELAPAVGLASGAAWALAACVGAGAGAGLAAGLGLAETHLVLAALAILGAVALAARAAARVLVPARRGA